MWRLYHLRRRISKPMSPHLSSDEIPELWIQIIHRKQSLKIRTNFFDALTDKGQWSTPLPIFAKSSKYVPLISRKFVKKQLIMVLYRARMHPCQWRQPNKGIKIPWTNSLSHPKYSIWKQERASDLLQW
jgi:hypothetical protein